MYIFNFAFCCAFFFPFEVHCVKRVELLLRRREALLSLSSMTLYREQGRPLQQECVHTTCFSAGSWSHVSVYFFVWDVFLFFRFFLWFLFRWFSAGPCDKALHCTVPCAEAWGFGLDAVCLDCGVIIFLSLSGSQKGQNERTLASAPYGWSYCCSWMAHAVKSLIS